MTTNGDTTFIVPEFLTKDFFQKSLNNGLNRNDIEVIDFTITMGSKSGDNYCSEVYRSKINYKIDNSIESVSLIVKAMPFKETRGPVLEEMEVFEKEVNMYTETLPKLSALLDNEFLGAK